MTEDQAKARFVTLSALRLLGALLVLLGILITQQRFAVPEFVGYILIAFGLFDVFLAPTLLARRWNRDKK